MAKLPKFPSIGTIARQTLMTVIVLVVIKAIGTAIPRIQTVPVLGPVFR
ncbi:MAG: hypothetical protein ABIJ18_05800 [archaeon]